MNIAHSVMQLRALRAALVRVMVAALLVVCVPSQAQTIDDVRIVSQGPDMVARVQFTASVRFRQQAPSTASALYRLTFDLVAGDEAVVNQTTEESKRVAAVGAVPEFTLNLVAAPGRRVKELRLQFAQSVPVKVRQGPSARAIDIVFAGFASRAAPAVAAPPPSAARPVDQRYAITLQSMAAGANDPLIPVPDRFKQYEVFGSNVSVDGAMRYEVNLGYFATLAEAEAVRQSALDRFPQATVLDLAKRRGETLQAAADSPPPASASAASSPPAPVSVVDKRAAELMVQAREALAARRNAQAVDLLNQLLLLPPNPNSQEAQELIGFAWERAGDDRRARTEYELYLKLFPEGEGAQRVSQRLASLDGGAAPAPVEAAKTESASRSASRSSGITGNIAQYYYGGVARSQSLVSVAAGINQATLTQTTESAIVTSADLGARYATADSETRLVLRGTNSLNLGSASHATSLLSAAYVDYKRNDIGLALRVGRQSPIGGGLLGLFDGASLAYTLTPNWKVDVMGGAPANPLVSAPSERLFAAMVEADGIAEHWGGDVYLITQSTEGIANRRAVGVEVRYSDEIGSLYSLLDYDTLFAKVNAVSIQGSIQAPSQTTVTMLIDVRKAPSLELTNALISYGATSLKTLMQMQALTVQQLRDAALQTTAEARQALISVSRPLSQKWQFSADLRFSEIGALPAVGNFAATEATGAQYGGTLQVSGSNLYSERDINNFNVSVLKSSLLRGVQFAYNNLTGLRDNDVTVEPSIRFYLQSGSDGSKLYRITPGLRGTYRFSKRASVLGEGLVEHSKSDALGNSATTNSVFFYVGYRYELF